MAISLRSTLLKLDQIVKNFGLSLIKKSFPCDSHRFLCYVCHRFRGIFKGYGLRQPNRYGIYTKKGLYIWNQNPHKTLIFIPISKIAGRGVDEKARVRDMQEKIREQLLMFDYMKAARSNRT